MLLSELKKTLWWSWATTSSMVHCTCSYEMSGLISVPSGKTLLLFYKSGFKQWTFSCSLSMVVTITAPIKSVTSVTTQFPVKILVRLLRLECIRQDRGKSFLWNTDEGWSPRCGTEETNLTSIHEDASSIPGLA